MLIANETVARHLTKLRVPMLYRVHEEPKPEEVESLNEFRMVLVSHPCGG